MLQYTNEQSCELPPLALEAFWVIFYFYNMKKLTALVS